MSDARAWKNYIRGRNTATLHNCFPDKKNTSEKGVIHGMLPQPRGAQRDIQLSSRLPPLASRDISKNHYERD